MKNTFLASAILLTLVANSQYSTYYIKSNSTVNANINANINANVNHNVSGSVYNYQNISTIDYGALAHANVQREKNALEAQKFIDAKQKEIAFEIAENPLKAYDYGSWLYWDTKDRKSFSRELLKQYQEMTNLQNFKWGYVIPNQLIFTHLNPYLLQNVSKEGIKTDVNIYLIVNVKSRIDSIDIELDFDNMIIGKELDEPNELGKVRKTMYHKKELHRATVYGQQGYKSTFIWEDRFENCITDNYTYLDRRTGVIHLVKVRTYSEKNSNTFEQLEGRRFYLKPLIEKIIATAKATDFEVKK